MTINKIHNNNHHHIDPVEGKREIEKQNDQKRKGASDSVNLSQEAKKLYEKKKAEQYEGIKQKIHDKFYDNPGVIDKVAKAILKEL